MRSRLACVALAMSMLAAYGAHGAVAAVRSAASRPCATRSTPPARYRHVVWVVMENKPFSSIVGAADAPYINALRAQCGSATRFFGERHPSLPNYIAMTSGATHGVADDAGPLAHPLDVPSIFSQVGDSGWRSLEESMPTPCLLRDSGSYAARHNPATYYTSVRAACGRRDVPLGATPDVSARFTFVTPNLCHDMHDCGVSDGDAWLKGFLPKVFASRSYRGGRTAVFLTWDEDDHSASNNIPTLVIAPSVRAGARSAKRFDHYSMLRTTEQMLGVGYLGRAAHASSMRHAFNL